MPEQEQKEREILQSFASRVDRNDPGALNNLGVLYQRKGMFEEAIAQFKQAITIDPKFELARENLWHVYRVTNIEDPDVERWKEKLVKNPEDRECQLYLGVSYHNIGRLDEAEKTLTSLVESDPEHNMARIRLGNVLKAKGRYREALVHYLRVSNEMDDLPVFHTDVGEIYYNLGRTQEAVDSLKKAIEKDSGYWKPHFLLSFVYGDEGMLDRALEESATASRLNPSFGNTEANLSLSEPAHAGGETTGVDAGNDIATEDSTSLILGIAYRERGYFKEALKEFELALLEVPEDDRLHMEIALLHFAEGRTEQAMEHLLKTLQIKPDNARAYKILGCEHHARGNLFEASACYLESYRLDSSDVNLLNNLGVLMYQTGLREDAERTFKKGLNRNLYHSGLISNILLTYILKEEYTMAADLLRQLERCAGDAPIFFEKRALFHFRMDKLDAAMSDVDRALELESDRSDALYLKSMIHLRRENLPEAVKAIRDASNVNERYTGTDLVLVSEHKPGGGEAVPPSVTFEPQEGMIRLLQASTTQGFDDVGEILEGVLERALDYEAVCSGEDEENRKDIENREEAINTGCELESDRQDIDRGAPGYSSPANAERDDRDDGEETTGFELFTQMIEDLNPK